MKQILWIYALLMGLLVVFAGLSVLISVFGARPFLVAQKLKVGAVIISLNTMLAGCYTSSKDTAPDAGSRNLHHLDTGSAREVVDTETETKKTDTETVASSDSPPEYPTTYCVDCYDTDYPEEHPTEDTDTATPGSDPPEHPTDDTDSATAAPSSDPLEHPTDDTDSATAAPSSDPPEYPTEYIECYDCYEYWGWDGGEETDSDTPSDASDAGPDSGRDD